MIKKILRGLLSNRQLHTATRFYEVVNTFSSLSPELIDDLPPGENVLVFAPHCDDEALGCGGTLYKHHLKGHSLTAVFMTDGCKCDSELSRDEIIQARKTEAKQAAKILGIERCIFLDYPDQQLQKTEEAIHRIEGILKAVDPDLVYLPFYLDNHPDHMETAAICLKALQRRPVKTIFFYEIWSALVPNQLVDITHVVDKKLEAVRIYKSQHDIESLAEQVKSLNRYRSINSDNQYKYAEAFLKLDTNMLDRFIQ